MGAECARTELMHTLRRYVRPYVVSKKKAH